MSKYCLLKLQIRLNEFFHNLLKRTNKSNEVKNIFVKNSIRVIEKNLYFLKFIAWVCGPHFISIKGMGVYISNQKQN